MISMGPCDEKRGIHKLPKLLEEEQAPVEPLEVLLFPTSGPTEFWSRWDGKVPKKSSSDGMFHDVS